MVVDPEENVQLDQTCSASVLAMTMTAAPSIKRATRARVAPKSPTASIPATPHHGQAARRRSPLESDCRRCAVFEDAACDGSCRAGGEDLLEELVSGARNARPDCANGNAADLGSFRVGTPDHLREHERFLALRLERGHQLAQRIRVVGVGSGADGGDVVGPFLRTAHPNLAAGRVGRGVPGDGEQPGAAGGLGPEPRERAVRPYEGVLSDVVQFGGRNQRPEETANLGLGHADCRCQRLFITVTGCNEMSSEPIHGGES